MKKILILNIIYLYNIISIVPTRPYPFISLMLHSVIRNPGPLRPSQLASIPTMDPVRM